MRITALAGGVGGARFLRGLLGHLDRTPELAGSTVTVIGNTGDDITLFGLRVSPDLDTVLYTLGGGVHEAQGWGRADETFSVQGELAAYGVEPQWFGLGDRDVGTHVARSLWLGQGLTLSQVTARLADRWGLPDRGVTLLPMTDTPVETHVVVEDEDGRRAVHFQEWWVRMRAAVPARQFVVAGMDAATPRPACSTRSARPTSWSCRRATRWSPSGSSSACPGCVTPCEARRAPVVGVSPIISGAPVRGHADVCLEAIGVESTAAGVAGLYADFLDGWLVASEDLALVPSTARLTVAGRPLLMSSPGAAADLAGAALDLGSRLTR